MRYTENSIIFVDFNSYQTVQPKMHLVSRLFHQFIDAKLHGVSFYRIKMTHAKAIQRMFDI